MALQKSLPVFHARAVTHVDMLTLPEDKEGYAYAYVFVNAFQKYKLIFRAKDKTAQHAATAILQHRTHTSIHRLLHGSNLRPRVVYARARVSAVENRKRRAPRTDSHNENGRMATNREAASRGTSFYIRARME